jgi:hypothetical protein
MGVSKSIPTLSSAPSDRKQLLGRMHCSHLQTAKMNEVDPHAWLTQTLERIAHGWPISNIDQLMPWSFKS